MKNLIFQKSDITLEEITEDNIIIAYFKNSKEYIIFFYQSIGWIFITIDYFEKREPLTIINIEPFSKLIDLLNKLLSYNSSLYFKVME